MNPLILLLVLLLPVSALADTDPGLKLRRDGQSLEFTAATLLSRPDISTITIPADVAYKRAMTYRAFPLANLLKENGFTNQGALNFLALDGYAAPIPAENILAATDVQPWLAVEDSASPWPQLSPDGSTAGPFYLVWRAAKNGDTTEIKTPPEHWPFQIATIKQTVAPEQRFPQILPDLTLPKHNPAWEGLALYKTHCMTCHKINGGGEGVMGPDLNLPRNPTEYFSELYLKKLIRDPAQVRRWPGMKMPGFNQEVMTDDELDALLAYLNGMVARRP